MFSAQINIYRQLQNDVFSKQISPISDDELLLSECFLYL